MRIFLSYHTPDKHIADALKTALEAKLDGCEVFVSHRDLRYGVPWQPQLSASIATADSFIILLGSKVGRWQLPEYYAAHNRAVTEPEFRLLPVLMAEDAPALPFLSSIHYLEAAVPASEPAISEIIAALNGETAGATSRQLWLNVNPYRGLESLREEDADFFFGREEETVAALKLFASPVNGIVTLIGNSGVGKSSLVEAGVFAALRRQIMPDGTPWPHALANSREWATITMRPGDDPIQALVAAFMDLWFGDMTDPDRVRKRNRWVELLRDGHVQLRDIIQATFDRFEKELALAAPHRILLNINQAEELYSLAPEATREPFSKLIAQALTDRRFAVIASLRSDYYGGFQENLTLFKAHARVDVLPFNAAELKTVITGPAAVLGARFESEGLPDFIVRGSAGQAGALPLLAFYMTDLWERMQKRGEGILRLAERTEIVDVARALATQADRFLSTYPNDEEMVKRLFTLRLALVQDEGKAVRHRVVLSRLNADEKRLIGLLSSRDWRLVSTGEIAGEAYAEVAHEILLQSWTKLAEWLESERRFLTFKGRYEQSRARWRKEGRDKLALLSGLDLIQAEQWLVARNQDFDAEEAEYIRQSVLGRGRQKLIGWALVVALLFAVGAGSLTLYAVEQRRIAEQARHQSKVDYEARLEAERKEKEQRLLAAEAEKRQVKKALEELVERSGAEKQKLQHEATLIQLKLTIARARELQKSKDSKSAVKAALEVIDMGGNDSDARSLVESAREILRDVILKFSLIFNDAIDSQTEIGVSANGERAILAFKGDVIRIWDTRAGDVTNEREGNIGAISPGGDFFVAWLSPLAPRNLPPKFYPPGGITPIRYNFIPEINKSDSNRSDSMAHIWGPHELHMDMGKLDPVGERDGRPSIRWSGDGKRIAVATASPVIKIYNAETGAVWHRIKMPDAGDGDGDFLRVHDVVFSPDSTKVLAIGKRLSTVRIFDISSEQVISTFREHKFRVGLIRAAAFSHDGSRVITGATEPTAYIWEVSTGRKLAALLHDSPDVMHVQFSPDDERVLTAARSGSVRLWDSRSGQPFGAPLDPGDGDIVSARFTENGKMIFSATSAGRAFLWKNTGELIFQVNAPFEHFIAATVLPDGDRIITLSSNGKVRAWTTPLDKGVPRRSLASDADIEAKAREIAGSIE